MAFTRFTSRSSGSDEVNQPDERLTQFRSRQIDSRLVLRRRCHSIVIESSDIVMTHRSPWMDPPVM
jgi:hypothetical protein